MPPPPPKPPPWFVPTGLAPPPRPAAEATLDALLALPPAELGVLADLAERLPSREQLLGAVRGGDAAQPKERILFINAVVPCLGCFI